VSPREIVATRSGRGSSSRVALISERRNVLTRAAAQGNQQRVSMEGAPAQGNDGEDADDDMESS